MILVSISYLAISLLVFFSFVELQKPILEDKKLISHAMGEVDGFYYTNSLEAFENSYFNKGSKIFEVDMELTKEEILVARHDWGLIYAKQLMQTPETQIDHEPWTHEYFMNQPINKNYTPLDIDGIIQLLKEYPDISIVTDTKHTEPLMIAKQFSRMVEAAEYDQDILSRIIPQIYNQEMFSVINNIYQFDHVIYTLYMSPDSDEEVLQFVSEHLEQISAVTLHTSRVSEVFVNQLHQLNLYVYTHPIFELEEALYYAELGVDGFYTGSLSNKELEMIKTD
ncbi:glycerophosphodiester phosphodiesterase [Bacillus sp. BGMRC 2118]|nr:glycerophosphodiester phosphodiesterase [Bacillus sp. BGMRC 2118]